MSTLALPTCESCEHFRLFYGEHPKRGECYGNLPLVVASGSHTAGETPPPKVRASRPGCWAHKPLPEGTPAIEKGKCTPETPGDAAKLAHITAPTRMAPVAPPSNGSPLATTNKSRKR